MTSRCDGKSWELNDRGADDEASILLRERVSLYFHCHCSLKLTSSRQFPFSILHSFCCFFSFLWPLGRKGIKVVHFVMAESSIDRERRGQSGGSQIVRRPVCPAPFEGFVSACSHEWV